MASLAVTSRSFSKHPLLRLEVLKRYPDAKFNDEGLSLNGGSLVEFLSGYGNAITALEIIDESVLSRLPALKVIGKFGVGLDMIDLHAMNKYGVKLGWTGGVNKRSVSELVVSFAIALLHRTVFASAEVRRGEWYQVKGRQLSDCTVGIVGCGHIGKDVVNLLRPFNCNILAHDIVNYKEFYKRNNVTPVGLDEVIIRSNVLTLHLPLNDSTRHIMNKERLTMLKDDSVLINLARGGLIDEDALRQNLLENKIGGAALDVLEIEPPLGQSFSTLDNLLITPHIGASTEEAILAMGMAAIEGLNNSKDPLYFE